MFRIYQTRRLITVKKRVEKYAWHLRAKVKKNTLDVVRVLPVIVSVAYYKRKYVFSNFSTFPAFKYRGSCHSVLRYL